MRYSKTLKVLNTEHGDLECEEVDYLPNFSYSKILEVLNIKFGNLECDEVDYLPNCKN